MKAIKRRRLTVKNISQITKAMNLVATSKLQRARNNLATVGKQVQATFDLVNRTFADLDENTAAHIPFLTSEAHDESTPSKTAYVLITGNRGLCGGYNSGVCKELTRHAAANGKSPLIIPLGTKGRDYFRRRSGNLAEAHSISESPSFAEAKIIADRLAAMYASGEVTEIFLVYTRFLTVLTLEPVVKPLLPISPDYLRRVMGENLHEGEKWENLGFFRIETSASESHEKNFTTPDIEYEPSLEDFITGMSPWYLAMFLYGALASSALCEQAARMTSMDSATKNAAEIIDKLTLMFNRQRQSIITQEITEIVSSANALQ